MPEALFPPIVPQPPQATTPRYVATRDHRGYSYTLDTQNGLAICCGNGEFVNPSSWELATRVAERLNEGRDPACYHWYPMGLVAFDEVRLASEYHAPPRGPFVGYPRPLPLGGEPGFRVLAAVLLVAVSVVAVGGPADHREACS